MEGPDRGFENKPTYILGGLAAYAWLHCEIDVWLVEGQFFLGHDAPAYAVEEDFLVNARLWCHAKNTEAFDRMLKNPLIHCFWHQEDDVVLTSRGFLWTFPGKPLTRNSICVLPEESGQDPEGCVGICSDFIWSYRKL
jgi:hypothetical protein